MRLLPLVDRAVVEEIGIGVVIVDFEDLGDIAAPRPTLNLNHDMEGVADIALDGAVRQLDAALQNAAREAGEALSGRVGVDGGQCPRVACIEKLQKIERLAAANLTPSGKMAGGPRSLKAPALARAA